MNSRIFISDINWASIPCSVTSFFLYTLIPQSKPDSVWIPKKVVEKLLSRSFFPTLNEPIPIFFLASNLKAKDYVFSFC